MINLNAGFGLFSPPRGTVHLPEGLEPRMKRHQAALHPEELAVMLLIRAHYDLHPQPGGMVLHPKGQDYRLTVVEPSSARKE